MMSRDITQRVAHTVSHRDIDIGCRNEIQRPTTEVHMPQTTATVGVRYMIDDVADAIAF